MPLLAAHWRLPAELLQMAAKHLPLRQLINAASEDQLAH
jgi:hypothetical protein